MINFGFRISDFGSLVLSTFQYNPLIFNYIYYFEIKKIRGQIIFRSFVISFPHSGMLFLLENV